MMAFVWPWYAPAMMATCVAPGAAQLAILSARSFASEPEFTK